MKVYTGRGDDGSAGLLSGERVPKSHERIDAVGHIDELCSAIGVIRAGLNEDDADTDVKLRRIQSDLLNIGSCLAAWRNTPAFECVVQIGDEDIRFLESSIDELQDTLPELKGFLLPGGYPAAAWTHFARAVCRRTERKVVALSEEMRVGRPPRQLRRESSAGCARP